MSSSPRNTTPPTRGKQSWSIATGTSYVACSITPKVARKHPTFRNGEDSIATSLAPQSRSSQQRFPFAESRTEALGKEKPRRNNIPAGFFVNRKRKRGHPTTTRGGETKRRKANPSLPREGKKEGGLVPPAGLEPATYGLKVRSSTN